MTTFDKIDTKWVQITALCITILLSRKWFTWLIKMPIFALFVCVWVIAYPYFWAHCWLKKHRGITYSEQEKWLLEKVCTEKFSDLIKFFTNDI